MSRVGNNPITIPEEFQLKFLKIKLLLKVS